MVMETPTALHIGREFVRQYYTVLNKTPLHLHRFYSQDSSFVHGGPEKQECVMGQHDIHQRIMQLNFRDCHAKIKQVDSLTTLGEGVVIQVTGELSNAGQPMRRFMQTFVLAPQQPLKYYVRNDIFRYQDEVFTEEEEEEEGSTVAEQAQEEVPEPLMAHHQAAHSEVVQHTADATTPLVNEAPLPPRGEQLGNGGSSPPSNSVAQTPGRPTYFDSQVMRNGTAHLVPEGEISSQASLTSGSPPEAPSSAATVATSNSMNWKDDESPAPPAAPQVNHQALPETKTYANMVSKNSAPISSAGFTSPSPAAPFGGAPTSGTGHGPASTGHPGRGFGGEPLSGGLPPRPDQRGGPRPQQQTRAPRSSLPPPTKRAESGRNESVLGSDDGTAPPPLRSSAKPQYPDNQQVFVGNLPHSVTEEQVRKRFEEFGHVLEFRMNSRSTSKMTAGGKAVPNCGFVIFESCEAVETVLHNAPIFINDTRVNVEEKKTKQKLATEGRGGSFTSGSPRSGGTGMMQRGPSGGRANGAGGRGGAFSRGGGRNPPGGGVGIRHN
uniref:Rasgap sh3 binding protein rasputin n=1 Tax=Rhipicephalus zambeziensis TaxID=60191 RepID=A0A224Z7C0_9ACAR